MTFGDDVKTEKGVKDLNTYLEDKSYISGFSPSQDINVVNNFSKPPAANYPHALRWYNHITSLTPEELKEYGTSPLKAGGTTTTTSAAATAPAKAADDDDDIDFFGSDDEEDAEAARIREERLKAYADKKSKKPELIVKSSIILDVKPWDDKTDMKAMEAQVRTIEMDGLAWGASKLVPVGYGINKLQVMCVVEAKVSVDLLVEKIEEFEGLLQSVDIVAFNKT